MKHDNRIGNITQASRNAAVKSLGFDPGFVGYKIAPGNGKASGTTRYWIAYTRAIWRLLNT